MPTEGTDGGISTKKPIPSAINPGAAGIVIRMLYHIIASWNNNDTLNNDICSN